jgi:hypothetical protein
MGWTTVDPMFDPRHRQVSGPDSCLLGSDVLLGVSRRFEWNEYLLLGILDLWRWRHYVASKRRHSPKETSHPKRHEFSKTSLLEPQTYHCPDRLWGPPSMLIQWVPGMHRGSFSFAARRWETETYLCCVFTLWIRRNNRHALINIVIRLQSRKSSFRIWHMGICISILHNFCS